MKISLKVLIFSQVLLLKKMSTASSLDIPNLDDTSHVVQGDLMIGAFTAMHRYSLENFCSESLLLNDVIYSEVFEYIADSINRNPDILPNITLGFQLMDDCQKDVTSLARAVSILQKFSVTKDEMCPADRDASSAGILVGVVGPSYSRQAVMVSSFLGLYEIPVLGTFTTSDELSDKTRFKYFMRLVPPDRTMVTAMMDLLDYFDWSYVSLLYSEGSYGENAGKYATQGIKNRGKCLAVSRRISTSADRVEVGSIIAELREHGQARVVILFLEVNAMDLLFGGLNDAGLANYFVFLAGDTLTDMEDLPTEPYVSGSFTFMHSEGPINGFLEHLASKDWVNSSNPWITEIKANYFAKNENLGIQRDDWGMLFNAYMTNHTKNFEWSTASKNADGVLVFANALHAFIAENCPEEFLKPNNHSLEYCMDGTLLLQHMRSLKIPGYSVEIAFDEIGDAIGQLDINQYMWKKEYGRRLTTIGRWDMSTQKITMDLKLLDPSVTMSPDLESICSKPCGPRQYYQIRELACCWDCRECRSNEIIVNEASCQQCPSFTWPDPETMTSCESIEPYYLQLREAMGICIVCLSALGVIATTSVIAVYAVKRKNRLLKATSRELSVMVLCGCLIACCVSMVFVRYPDEVVCPLRQTGFHFSVCVTYSPLLVKTSRIYRIFNAGKKGVSRPKFISSRAQLLLASIIVAIQFALLVILELEIPSRPELIMPFATERYVEVTCSFTMTSFIPPLAYNMAVIASCGVLGFLTKKLPENFNDSRYIFVSISTTFFMWLVILPTYFTTFHSHHKAVLLSVCLLLNAFITLLCQFGTKIYAVFLVKDEKIIINTLNTTTVDAHSSVS